ncbi:hypothetical protein FAVG1_07627 [Fusarium avenaceum]|nr:hypothetical protein FAVG1_07627 [Fusarium avenaceum]
MVRRIDIEQGWEFKQASSLENGTASTYLPIAQFPTVAHIDLLSQKLIPDPYIDINELKYLWVNNADWTYHTQKIDPVNIRPSERAILVFEGLDTVVDIYLNDEHILFSNNMHITHRIDVTETLRDRTDYSILKLRFKAAPAYARSERERIRYKTTKTGREVNFGGSERLFIFESRIDDLWVTQDVDDDLSSVVVTLRGKIENPGSIDKVRVQLSDDKGNTAAEAMIEVSSESAFHGKLKLEKPKLWYPFLYGEQHLYLVEVSIPGQTRSQKLGVRKLRLLQHPLKDQPGTSFIFELNNIRLFCGGSCWIPADFMLPRISRDIYKRWLAFAKAGNQSMIRIWGGGIVESDEFYDICDREGILVWQDFLYACGNYPAPPDFVTNIKVKAEQQVKRVRHHASLALWYGNNEDYICANGDRYWEVDYSDTTGPWDKTTFPAREIYERTLPTVINASETDIPYWISSPYSGPGHQRRYPIYIGENYRFRINPLKDFIYYTQFLQAEAMAYAYNWAERIITAKPPYITTGYPDEKSKLDVWAVNGELHERTVILDLEAYDIESGKAVEWTTPYEEKEYILKANQTTELVANIEIPNHDETVVVAYLYDNMSGTMLARWVSWPEPLKFLQMSSELKVSTEIVENGRAVVIKANAPAKGVVLSGTDGNGEAVVFEDNFIDLVPGEEIRVGIRGLAGDHVDVRFLYDWELEPGFEL